MERKKANDEMGRVRESMKEVLERERMLMGGGLLDRNEEIWEGRMIWIV